jgi:hypothetical protein
MNESALRELLTLQEKYHRAVNAAKGDLISGHRQLIEKLLQQPDAAKEPSVLLGGE